MNEGFKGRNVNLERIELGAGAGGAPLLRCTVQFRGDDGTVHATTRHELLLEEDDPLTEAAKGLLETLLRRVESIHFNEPRDAVQTQKLLKGIAETIQGQSDEPVTR